ncbi:AEC family transporter [Agrobacterium sp. NPDC058088]|uniref:AEC family transporter n=1 Tax=Agrobacterium sp. NPDC058088 TaxID=3346335 RepID=UPI0036D9E85C
MIEIILQALVPIFFVIALGYFAGKHRTIDNHHVTELNALVMQFALPASLFVATATTAREKMFAEGTLFLLLAITMMAFYAIWYGLKLRDNASHGEAAVQALTIALPNYAAAGLPIMLAVIGPQATVHVAVAIAAGSILPTPITLLILELSRTGLDGTQSNSATRLRNAMIDAVAKPIVLAPVCGTLVSLSGLQLDVLVTSSLQLIGHAAGGVALFLTGLVLSSQPFQLDRHVVAATLLSNIAQPLFVFGLTRIIPTSPDIAAVAILLAALPSGFFGILFGVNYNVASREAGSMVIASTICSMVTVGAAILFLYPR